MLVLGRLSNDEALEHKILTKEDATLSGVDRLRRVLPLMEEVAPA
jgi:hypothetical protein